MPPGIMPSISDRGRSSVTARFRAAFFFLRASFRQDAARSTRRAKTFLELYLASSPPRRYLVSTRSLLEIEASLTSNAVIHGRQRRLPLTISHQFFPRRRLRALPCRPLPSPPLDQLGFGRMASIPPIGQLPAGMTARRRPSAIAGLRVAQPYGRHAPHEESRRRMEGSSDAFAAWRDEMTSTQMGLLRRRGVLRL